MIVKDTLNNLSENCELVIEKVKKFVRKLRKSGVDRDLFLEVQLLESGPIRWLKKGIDVRWNSLHDMLARFVENRRVIEMFLLDDTKGKYPKFDLKF